MKASEAKEISSQATPKIEEMKAIYDTIKSHAKVGKFCCYYYKQLSQLQLKNLKDDAYEVVNLTDQREGTLYLIQWK